MRYVESLSPVASYKTHFLINAILASAVTGVKMQRSVAWMAPTGSILLHLACRWPTASSLYAVQLSTNSSYLWTEELIHLIKGKRVWQGQLRWLSEWIYSLMVDDKSYRFLSDRRWRGIRAAWEPKRRDDLECNPWMIKKNPPFPRLPQSCVLTETHYSLIFRGVHATEESVGAAWLTALLIRQHCSLESQWLDMTHGK